MQRVSLCVFKGFGCGENEIFPREEVNSAPNSLVGELLFLGMLKR